MADLPFVSLYPRAIKLTGTLGLLEAIARFGAGLGWTKKEEQARANEEFASSGCDQATHNYGGNWIENFSTR